MKLRRWFIALPVALALLTILSALGLFLATRALKSQVETALGPNSEVGAIQLHWNAIELVDLRIKAHAPWPAADELRAARVRIEPEALSLLSKRVRIARIVISDGYLSTLRGTDGKFHLLPSLLEVRTAHAVVIPAITLDEVSIDNGAMDFFDATVRKPPLRLRLGQLRVDVGPVALPELTGQTTLNLQGIIKGARRDGKLAVDGWLELASRNASIKTQMSGVELVALQAYLIKTTETGVRAGTLDLDLATRIKDKHLHAPGSVNLHNLELAEGGGGFLGMPRQAVIATMRDRDKNIQVKFELDGNIDDPQFKLNENLAARLGSSLASTLGISFEGIARGAGTVGGAVGGAAQGIGKALKGLMGK